MADLSNNPLRTRRDLQQSLADLAAPLKDYGLRGGYHLGDTAAVYSPAIARMEALSRTLWGAAPLIAGGGGYAGSETLLALIKEGLDPGSAGYWGDLGNRDQRLVELSAIGFALLIARDVFWDGLDTETRERLASRLSSVQQREYPPGNWLYFRMMVLFALRNLGFPVDEEQAEQDMAFLDTCYRGDGWFQDGPEGCYDFYNPWGFHFYGLLYGVFAGKRDPERAARYLEAARVFLPRFAAWFREDGSHIPYGRSLTYRFAAVSVFSACAFAGQELLPWGVLKGLVLRSLRYWFSQPILDRGGVLSIGCGYPNLLTAEYYNAPGSPYWGLKAYLVLALPESHPFWQAEEAPLPEPNRTFIETIPGFIISKTQADAVLLCSGQNLHHDSGQAAAKYNKFAYSARFGFSVSLSSYQLDLCGADSTLLLSDAAATADAVDQADFWKERRSVRDKTVGANWIASTWNPWRDVSVRTALISLGAAHVRVHRIRSGRALLSIEGGFSITRRSGDDLAEPVSGGGSGECLAAFPWGASRIAALEPAACRKGQLIRSAPNLNLVHTHGVIPALEGPIEPGETMLITAVRAGDRDAAAGWTLPSITLEENGGIRIHDRQGSTLIEGWQ